MARSKQVSVVRGKPHAAFEAAGAGNVAWSKCWDTRNRKGEQQGIQTSTYTGAPVLDPTHYTEGRKEAKRPENWRAFQLLPARYRRLRNSHGEEVFLVTSRREQPHSRHG